MNKVPAGLVSGKASVPGYVLTWPFLHVCLKRGHAGVSSSHKDLSPPGGDLTL